MRNSLQDQLSNVFGKDNQNNQQKNSSAAPQRKKSKKKNPLSLPRVSDWQGDGIDHINLSSHGLTDLGRTLHPASRLEFNHDVFGRFNSVSAFWDWLETGARNDRLRMLPQGQRKELKASLERFNVDYLEFFILDACWQRLKAYPQLLEVLKDSTLPFDIYRTVGEMHVPLRYENSLWLVEGMEMIRSALKKGFVPNFVWWSNHKKRRTIIEEYCALHIQSTRNTAPRVPKDNELLRTLRNNGPVVQQPKRKLPVHKKKEVTAPLETLSKVEVWADDPRMTEQQQAQFAEDYLRKPATAPTASPTENPEPATSTEKATKVDKEPEAEPPSSSGHANDESFSLPA